MRCLTFDSSSLPPSPASPLSSLHPQAPQSSSQAAHEPLTVFFHGFPGIRSQQNRDIAEDVARLTGRRSLVALYSGLGHAPGRFSFDECLLEVSAFFQGVLAAHPGPVDLVGHSWGGHLSLRLAAEYPERIRRMTLLSPLLKFFTEEVCATSFAQTAQNNASISLGNTDDRARELARIGNETPTQSLLPKLSPDLSILILQSRTDEVTPAAEAESLLGLFPRAPCYELVEIDHSFVTGSTGRKEIAARIAEFLNS